MKQTIIDAILIKDITYSKDGREYLVKKDTTIKVDPINFIALVDNEHIDICQMEYTLFN
jgi:hypothetical protein